MLNLYKLFKFKMEAKGRFLVDAKGFSYWAGSGQ